MDGSQFFPPPGEMGEIEDECASVQLDHEALLGWRLGALFGIMAVSTAGVALPFLTKLAKLHNLIFIMKAFAGGVVLATGFIHILQDAVEGLADPCLGWPDYPWAMMFATFASLITFTFEWHLHKYFTNAFMRNQDDCADMNEHRAVHMSDADESHDGVVMATPAQQAQSYRSCEKLKAPSESGRDLERIMYSVQSCTLELGIIFHSIFIGISLGLNTDRSSIQSLMIALMFHQFNEGLAIGLTFIQARFSTLRYWLLGASFLLTTPLGVAVGIVIGGGGYSNKALTATEGVFNAFSAGILLYNGLVDLIVPTFSVHDDTRGPIVQMLGFVALLGGAGVMSVIGLWA